LFCTFVAAINCVCALWPRQWVLNGYDPDMVQNISYQSELEVLEALAKGLSVGKGRNSMIARRVAIFLRIAWLSFCLAPVAAGSVAAIVQAVHRGHLPGST
jgi:hypothetical protein